MSNVAQLASLPFIQAKQKINDQLRMVITILGVIDRKVFVLKYTSTCRMTLRGTNIIGISYL
jgi:hypothetical protein